MIPEAESLDRVFEVLLKQTNALSAKASNEIQLVIGSVTILVSPPQLRLPCMTAILRTSIGFRHDETAE